MTVIKKGVIFILTVSACMFILAGCGGNGVNNKSPEAVVRSLIRSYQEQNFQNIKECYGLAEDEEVRIIRTKQYDLKPLYPEDACVQMEMLGHSFYVFVNAETDQVNVVYKRKGNTYGLLEPEN